MTNVARFTINSDPSANGGYEASAGGAISLQIEGSPSVVVNRVVFEVYDAAKPDSPLASLDAPTLVLDNGAGSTGQFVVAETPGSAVTTAMPSSGVHSWIIRCTANGGVNYEGAVDPDYVYERMVSLMPYDLRKEVYGETTQWSATGPADAQNGLVDAYATISADVEAAVSAVASVELRWNAVDAFDPTPLSASQITVADTNLDLLNKVRQGSAIKWLCAGGVGGIGVVGDIYSGVSSEAFTGISEDVLSSEGLLYASVIETSHPNYYVEFHNSPSLDAAHLVAHTAEFDVSTGGALTVVEDNDSGLGGTITIAGGVIGGEYSFGIVAMWAAIVRSISGGVITIDGRPLITGGETILGVWSGAPELVQKRSWRLDGSGGAPLVSTSDTLLDDEKDAPFLTEHGIAQIVKFRAYAFDHGSGTGKVNLMNGSQEFSTTDSGNGLTISAAKTWYETGVDVSPLAVLMTPNNDIEFACKATDAAAEALTAEFFYIVLAGTGGPAVYVPPVS